MITIFVCLFLFSQYFLLLLPSLVRLFIHFSVHSKVFYLFGSFPIFFIFKRLRDSSSSRWNNFFAFFLTVEREFVLKGCVILVSKVETVFSAFLWNVTLRGTMISSLFYLYLVGCHNIDVASSKLFYINFQDLELTFCRDMDEISLFLI